jgi:glycosyltransferase involved in cell wall biosynthesis
MNADVAEIGRTAGPAVAAPAPDREPLRLTMVSWMVAGIRTHYQNVRPVAEAAPDVALTALEINPWRKGGRIERLPLVPDRVKGSLRTYASTLPLYTVRPVDVIWTQVLHHIAPFIFTRAAAQRIPLVYDADSTPRLLASYGVHYAEQVAGAQPKRRAVDFLMRAGLARCAAVVGWSEWAARSFVADYGVAPERVRVIPPGVDVVAWAAPAGLRRQRSERLQLLFVGADFERKGGDLLLDIWRRHFADRCELHLVTRGAVAPAPHVHVYRDFAPNDPGLRRLYHTCDALVLPTRADCFSLASIEAMAAGIPVVTSAVGGIPEIVADGVTGYLVAPDDGAGLRAALAALVEDPGRRERMGVAAREAAVTRFDAAHNAGRLLGLLREVARGPKAP